MQRTCTILKQTKNQLNINDVEINKIVLFNKASYDKHGANKYYIGYLSGGFRDKIVY